MFSVLFFPKVNEQQQKSSVVEEDLRQDPLLHDEGERVKDALSHLSLQWREEVRDDLEKEQKNE